ncbi:MAG: endonuclease/exonuclease/phosphatase family protein [Deltaproteobacteria bacterium]|nr:endonuclease/exonuclease/phosphatase family protein [Deltaproteobacteria bacterium]MBI3387214.1 endonuclease/exonuclease/phosphatase family protein [Deltaproteobacteria bacterium]
MRICFWNVARKPVSDLLAGLCEEYDLDILILAESTIPLARLILALNRGHRRLYYADASPGLSDRLTIVFRLSRHSMETIADDFAIAVRHVRPPLRQSFLLVALHLPSQLYRTPDDLAHECPRIARLIADREQRVGHRRTVVIGDFNMDPFDHGMVGSGGLHAVSDRRVTQRGERIVSGEVVPFFYNPMWSKLGDAGPHPPGTYYYDSSTPINLYWHVFDQVLLRPALCEEFDPRSVQVVTRVDGTDLLAGARRRPNQAVSDHLPLVVDIPLAEEFTDG